MLQGKRESVNVWCSNDTLCCFKQAWEVRLALPPEWSTGPGCSPCTQEDTSWQVWASWPFRLHPNPMGMDPQKGNLGGEMETGYLGGDSWRAASSWHNLPFFIWALTKSGYALPSPQHPQHKQVNRFQICVGNRAVLVASKPVPWKLSIFCKVLSEKQTKNSTYKKCYFFFYRSSTEAG